MYKNGFVGGGVVTVNPHETLKRSIELMSTSNERPLAFDLSRVNPGSNVQQAISDLIAIENPENTVGLYNQNQEIYWPQFADWAIQNPNILSTVFRSGYHESKGPIYELFPIAFVDESYIHRNTILFGRDFVPIHTMKTNPEHISARVWTVEGHMQFAMQGFVIDDAFFRTSQDAPRWFEMMMTALYKNMWCYVTLNVWNIFWTTPTFYKTVDKNYPFSDDVPKTPEEALEKEREFFCVANKRPQFIHDVIKKFNVIFGQEGFSLANLIIPDDDMFHINHRDTTNTSVELSGNIAYTNRTAGDTLAGVDQSVRIIGIPFMTDKLHDINDHNVMKAVVACGSFARFPANFYSGTGGSSGCVDPAEYRNFMSDIRFVSWKSNTWDVYTYAKFLRNCVQFVPLVKDITETKRTAGKLDTRNQGKLDRELLLKLAKTTQEQKGLHKRTRTDYSKCPDELDPLLLFNKHHALGTTVTSPDAWWYPVGALGELPESKASSCYLSYIFKCMERAIWEGISEKEKDDYSQGLALMEKLSSVESNNVQFLVKTTASPTVGYHGVERTNEKNVYFVEPNEFGGPLYRNNDMEELGGLGTVSGLLTIIAHYEEKTTPYDDPKVTRANYTASKLKKTDIFETVYKEAKAFINVFEKITKKCLMIDQFHAALSPSLLPAFHRHNNMKPIHASMIVLSYFIVGPFKYPSLISFSYPSSPSDITGAGDFKPNEVVLNALKTIENTTIFKKDYSTVNNLKTFVDSLKEDTWAEINAIVKAENEGAAPKPVSKYLKKTLSLVATKDDIPKLTRELHANVGELVNAAKIVYDYATNAETPLAGTSTYVDIKNAVNAYQSSDANAVQKVVIPLHFSIGVLQTSTAFSRPGIAVINTGNVGDKFIHMIDVERETNGGRYGKFTTIFEDEDANLWGGTLISSLPFVCPGYPCVPRSGHSMATNLTCTEKLSLSGDSSNGLSKRSVARYASGYPLTETTKTKLDHESSVISKYEKEEIFKLSSFATWKTKLTAARDNYNRVMKTINLEEITSDVIIQAIAYPFSGHPKVNGELTAFERRWAATYTCTDTLGFASRFLLMCHPDLNTQLSLIENHIPPLFGGTIFRNSETQWSQAWAGTVRGPIGNVYVNGNGFDNIASHDSVLKQIKFETSITMTPWITDPRMHAVMLNVRGLDKIGGKGNEYVNQGIPRTATSDWTDKVTSIMTDGARMGHTYTNVACLQSLNTAHETNYARHVDIRGDWKYADWAMRVEDPQAFLQRGSWHSRPMYDGQAMLVDTFFPNSIDPIPLRQMDYSYANIAGLRQQNHVCSQTTVSVFDPNLPGGYRLLQSHHLWGDQLPDLCSREQGMAYINKNDHIKGNGYSLF